MGIFDFLKKADARKNVTKEELPKESIQPETKLAPAFYPDLDGYQMNMHTDSSEKYCFTLTGLKLYHPNMSSRCGDGSDDWFFHCKYEGEDRILRFSDNAGYGTMWDCALITRENAEQLRKQSVAEWDAFVTRSENRISRLHPDAIDAAKKIVQATASRCGPISDKKFYGQ